MASGASRQTQHQVLNTGASADIYDFAARNDQDFGVSVNPGQLSLESGAQRPVTLTLTVPPTAIAQTVSTTYLTATSSINAGVFDRVLITTTVALVPGVTISPEITTQSISRGTSAVFVHTVTNIGNFTDTFDLAAVNRGQDFPISVSPTQLTLGPFESVNNVQLTVDVPVTAADEPGFTRLYITSTLNAGVHDFATDITVHAP